MDNKSSESKSKKILAALKYKINAFKKRIGMLDKKTPISFELSEFMQETQLALQKLPLNYQKLYELKPAEENFFINREKEIEKLKKSFTNWTKDRFVTCAVIGEKGSGVTSTLNYFLRTIKGTEVIRCELHEKIYAKDKYFTFFNSLLKTDGIGTNKELIDFLNNTHSAKIIIIENLQHMFLKQIGGFEAMKMLFELVSYTTKKVFWVGVFTPVSWNYLDKTLSISNYFTSEIEMKQLSYGTIKDIIFKRNECEKHFVRFSPKEETLESKSFKKLDEKEKQLFLQEQFFKILHRLSNGNISLAQLYWVRAIETIDEQTINIKEIDNLDYYFIKNLSVKALFTLQTLLLHDGLTLHDFAIATNESEIECRKMLMPMLERGLLIQEHQKYNINPVIYKPVYDYLSSKNFIH